MKDILMEHEISDKLKLKFIPKIMMGLFKTKLSHSIVDLKINKEKIEEVILMRPTCQYISQTKLTISQDRGWKPTVNPWNTRAPGFSHGTESSTITLQHLKRPVGREIRSCKLYHWGMLNFDKSIDLRSIVPLYHNTILNYFPCKQGLTKTHDLHVSL